MKKKSAKKSAAKKSSPKKPAKPVLTSPAPVIQLHTAAPPKKRAPYVGATVHYHVFTGFKTIEQHFAALITETGPNGETMFVYRGPLLGNVYIENVRFSERPADGRWSWISEA